MSKEQKINVNFNNYLPYDSIPYTCINLGQVTSAQLNAILTEFAKNTSRPHTCIQTMNIEFSDSVSFGRIPGSGKRHRNLELSNMFYFYDVNDAKTHAPCMAGRKQPQTEDTMVKACANNLRCGKCRDEFIRRTLGIALFPQKYSNENQK